MVRFYYDEKWKEFTLDYDAKFRYAISNHGRLLSFTDEMAKGRLLEGSKVDGYKIFRYKIFQDKKIYNKHRMFHRLVAENFLETPSEEQTYVLHLDFNKLNNHHSNLQWATKEEMVAHNKKSPAVIKAKKKLIEHNKNRDGHKLTATKVMLLKQKIFDPNRKTRLKLIARQFGISEMQLYRIKTGENWGHIKSASDLKEKE